MATAEEDYEILPHQLLADLKQEVEALKKKLTQPDAKANELILEIESLKDSIHELNVTFEKALEQTKEDDLAKTIKIASERLETIATQNETIAKGMIAISDKLEDFMSKQASVSSAAPMPSMMPPRSAIMQHTMGPPQMRGPRMAPPMEAPAYPEADFSGGSAMDFPPPPPAPGGEKKKMIGSIFK